MARRRNRQAGVTLVEVLVVLAIFSVLTGAAALSVSRPQNSSSADLSALSLAADITYAMDLALGTGSAFGMQVNQGRIQFLERNRQGDWNAHSDPRLNALKLYPIPPRILDEAPRTETTYLVSERLVPQDNQALSLAFGGTARARVVVFDGATVRITDANGDGNETQNGQRF